MQSEPERPEPAKAHTLCQTQKGDRGTGIAEAAQPRNKRQAFKRRRIVPQPQGQENSLLSMLLHIVPPLFPTTLEGDGLDLPIEQPPRQRRRPQRPEPGHTGINRANASNGDVLQQPTQHPLGISPIQGFWNQPPPPNPALTGINLCPKTNDQFHLRWHRASETRNASTTSPSTTSRGSNPTATQPAGAPTRNGRNNQPATAGADPPLWRSNQCTSKGWKYLHNRSRHPDPHIMGLRHIERKPDSRAPAPPG